MRPDKPTFIYLEIVTVAAYVWYVWSVTRRGESTRAGFYSGVAQCCYRTARRIGRIGMRAEHAAYVAMEQERL